jgi:hypothetical protein
MTIVLQHQYSNLKMDEASRVMSVGLSFSGVPSTLVIPIAAITAFADPEVRFGMSFDVEIPAPPAPEEAPRAAPPGLPGAPGEIVSLDAFRRRPKE